MWHSTIRLLITLSSSFLLITMGLVEKIFPDQKIFLCLELSWIGYFLTVIFGVCTEINEIIFHQNDVRDKSTLLGEISKKINEGYSQHEFDVGHVYTNNGIVFGFLCINFFIFSTALLCISFLERVEIDVQKGFLIGLVMTLLGVLDFYFLKIRKA